MQYLPEKHLWKSRQAQQCKISKDKRSGIESNPNRIDDQGYIVVCLVAQVITVSVETVKLVNVLAQAVMVEDWLGDAVEMKE
ncbi:MAG TPA: hypothetical protein VGL94_17960 [Ktedonobacteraceae bacterium]|jgi:hypothetical protein